jgi:hypothetical protein
MRIAVLGLCLILGLVLDLSLALDLEVEVEASPLNLYGIQSDALAQGFQLALINLNNGSQTQVGTDYPFDLNLYQQISVDLKNNILYALLSDTADCAPSQTS